MVDALRTRLSARLLIPAVVALVCGSVVSLPASAEDAPALPVAPAAVERTGPGAATDQFIVKFKEPATAASGLPTESYGKVARNLGVPVSDVRGTSGGARVLRAERSLDAGETERALTVLRTDPAVEYAEPDTRIYPTAIPNDPFYGLQWGLGDFSGSMNMPGAWAANQGAGVVVAVVDTGITSHSDLNANVLPGYDMMSDPAFSRDADGRDANPHDDGDWTSAGMCGAGIAAKPSSWHGTQVASIIAAAANNGTGITGVAPEAKVLPVRALGSCGGRLSDVIDGIIWAAGGTVAGAPVNPTPARVINLSLGAIQPCSPAFQNAVDFAYNSGAAVVAAAGNDGGPAADSSPANCRNVISVAAVARTGLLAPYSNYGSAVDVAAPGGDMSAAAPDGILVAYNQGTQAAAAEGYAYSEGTSMAAPHASGLAALLMSRLGDLATPANVEARLKATSHAAGCVAPKTCGSGVLDGPAALNFQADRQIIGTAPTIGGEAVVGNSLSADAPNWTPSDTTFSYQWYRNGTPILGAQAASYGVQAADAGTHLTATVTGSRFFGNSLSLTSAPTSTVTAGPVVPPNDPAISGQAIVGGLLTASAGTWQPAPVALAYQWLRSGQVIPGAVASTYRVAAGDTGQALSVRVTGTKVTYIPVQRTSAETVPVVTGAVPAPVVTVPAPAPVATGPAPAPVATGAVPAPVQFTDRIGAPNDTYTVPSVAGVEYLVAGIVVPAGTYPGAGSVTVVSRATAGHVLVDGAVSVWSFTFDPVVFNDVTDASAFSNEISWMALAGISEGWTEPDGTRTYRALLPISRDAMAAFLYRMAGSPQYTPPAVSPFADVSTGQQFYKEMAWLADRQISTGWTEPDGSRSYRAAQTISRDAMAAFLYRMAGSPAYTPPGASPFADVSTGQQFYKEMAWLAQNGISTGWTEAGGALSYRPLQPVSRDAMAAFLFRLHNLIP